MVIYFLSVVILLQLPSLYGKENWNTLHNRNGLWGKQQKSKIEEANFKNDLTNEMSPSSNSQSSRSKSLKLLSKSLTPIPGISSFKICSENSIVGIKACEDSCVSKIINCVGKYCFCNCRGETMSSDSTRSKERIDTNSHVCGENTYAGIISCRRTCANAKDLILCFNYFCYCNINIEEISISALDFSKSISEGQQSSKYDISKVLSSWKCNMMRMNGIPVAGLKQCFYECGSMKSSTGIKSTKNAVMLTCNTQNKNCACITFKTLSDVEKREDLKTQKIKIPTIRKTGSCRGYACFIQNLSTVKPLSIDRPVHNFIFCGPNRELGFTKCRDMCRFEKRGVVRCAGHSCYCHFGGVPFVHDKMEHENQASTIGAPFQSRFTPCGKTKKNCQSICQFIGDIVCGRLGCYCDSGL